MPNESSKLKENTLGNLLTVSSHLSQFETTVENFVVTKELLHSAQTAGINYQAHLKEEKNEREVKKAEEKKKKEAEEAAFEKKKKPEEEKLDIEKREEKLMSLKEKEQEDLNGATHLLNEANSPRSRCRISVPIESLLKTKFLILFMINKMYIYQGAYQNVAANIFN